MILDPAITTLTTRIFRVSINLNRDNDFFENLFEFF